MNLDFTQAPPKASTLEEAQNIIDALWQLCRELSQRFKEQDIRLAEQQVRLAEQQKEIELLKEKLRTNSDNSSKPPSSDPFKKKKNEKKSASQRKRGGQLGHKGISRSLLPVEEVSRVEKCTPSKRCACGSKIRQTGNYRRHQVHELPRVKALVTEYQLYTGVCHGCGQIHQSELPEGVPSGMLGVVAMAKVAVLTGDYRMSKRNVTSLFNDFYGLTISIGTVSNTEKKVSEALKEPVEEAKRFIPQQSVVNADETSHKENGSKMWTWVTVSALVAVFIIRSSRGAKVIKEFLGETFKGILCTDRWSGYAWMATISRQLCWAHLKRDFQKISERCGKSHVLGQELLAHQKRLFHYWHEVKAGRLSRKQLKVITEPIRKRVEALLTEGSTCSHEKTAGTCEQILKVKEALWTFIDKEGVEPTNNIAEQVLRRIVIWRKTSFGTQSTAGTLYLERIMTVVASCKLQQRNILDFVTQAICAHLGAEKVPSLIPEINCESSLDRAA